MLIEIPKSIVQKNVRGSEVRSGDIREGLMAKIEHLEDRKLHNFRFKRYLDLPQKKLLLARGEIDGLNYNVKYWYITEPKETAWKKFERDFGVRPEDSEDIEGITFRAVKKVYDGRSYLAVV